MKNLFAAAVLAAGATAMAAPAQAEILTKTCQVEGEKTEFTLSLDTKTDQLTLTGTLGTPTPGYGYRLIASDHFNKDSHAAHMELILDRPAPTVIQVIGDVRVNETFDRPKGKSVLYVHALKDYMWGTSRMACPIPRPEW